MYGTLCIGFTFDEHSSSSTNTTTRFLSSVLVGTKEFAFPTHFLSSQESTVVRTDLVSSLHSMHSGSLAVTS